nr:hypothetical protein CFP56_43331 [Quercus suber]
MLIEFCSIPTISAYYLLMCEIKAIATLGPISSLDFILAVPYMVLRNWILFWNDHIELVTRVWLLREYLRWANLHWSWGYER